MDKVPDRALLTRLVDAYEQIAEESLGMGDPEIHEVEEQLFDAIDESGYRAVIKKGSIYLPDPNGLPGEIILVDPAEAEDLADPDVLNLDKG
jgi:hypothetical protein